MSLKYQPKAAKAAKALRKNMTREERHLWYDFLASFSPRFQRQKPIGQYIADFYCHEAGLVIEIDGSGHFTPSGKQADAFRTERLELYGLTVIRFNNFQINTNFQGVCRFISLTVAQLTQLS